jgi:hypothetical protein
MADKNEEEQIAMRRSPESEDEEVAEEYETDSDSDEEEEELQYRGLVGLFYRAKDFVEDAVERANEREKISKTVSTMKTAGKTGWNWGGKGAKVLWIVGTTMVVMVLPLVLEVEREQTFIEQAQQQEALLRSQGYTPQQLAQMGYGAGAQRR